MVNEIIRRVDEPRDEAMNVSTLSRAVVLERRWCPNKFVQDTTMTTPSRTVTNQREDPIEGAPGGAKRSWVSQHSLGTKNILQLAHNECLSIRVVCGPLFEEVSGRLVRAENDHWLTKNIKIHDVSYNPPSAQRKCSKDWCSHQTSCSCHEIPSPHPSSERQRDCR